jgi:predicted  nucleic acid-binding Zn-ribbon protein
LRSSEFKERAELAEDQLKSIRQEVSFLNSEIERITKYQSDFDSKIQRKEAELKSYKENVSCYVNLKVSQRNIFGLTLEISR